MELRGFHGTLKPLRSAPATLNVVVYTFYERYIVSSPPLVSSKGVRQDGRTNEIINGRTDRRTDGRTDGRIVI